MPGRCRAARLATALAVGGLLLAAADAGAAPGAIDARAAGQVDALQDLKRSALKGPERKLDSRLVVAAGQRSGELAALPKLDSGVAVTAAGATDVDIRARVSPALLDRLARAGARVRYASARLGAIRATVPLAALDRIAGWAAVDRIGAAARAMTAGIAAPAARESKAAKAVRLDRALARALAPGQGTIVSEGDKAHAADVARARSRVTGTGVKLCALSDGVDSLAASEAAGELPPVDVLPGEEGDGDEGTAMLEILHDLAPGAQLGFATAFTSDASFADNIRALRFDAGCDVIVDDVLYFNESPFQDGPIAQSVDAVTADGGLYFSSAGNEGNVLDGTSGNYEGDFSDSGRGVGKFAGTAHDFDPGPGVQVFEPLSRESVGVPVTLWWADPLGHAANDYDLYLFDAAGNVLGVSQDVQNGDDDPYEILGTGAGTTQRLAVVRFSGAPRYLQLSALRGRYTNSADGLTAYVSPGITRGHSAARDAFSTAAAPASVPLPFDLETGDPPNPGGPFPNPFTAAQLPERFTSDGPRRIFFEADGTPITPGDFSATGGTVRLKPDFTAADGVRTSVDGFDPFFGTSAAAPHLAAIAGLIASGNPGIGTAEVREAFAAAALDLSPAGIDPRTGAGIVRADLALRYTGATPQPLVTAGTPTLTAEEGDGDGYLERGETGTLDLPVTNTGDGTATGVSVVLTDADPLTTITPRNRAYGNLAAGATKTKPFQVELAATYPVGKPLALTARVTFAGRLSPTTTTVRLPTGQPAAAPTDFAYAGPPVTIPDNSAVGASVPIPVNGIGYASAITFSIDGTSCSATPGSPTVGLDHTYVGDLVGTLTAPGGAVATVFARDGGGGNNLCQAVFDDAATKPFTAAVTADAPYTGAWRPETPLAALLAAPADGTWTFKVVDAALNDVGSIRAVSLHLTGFATD